MSSVATMAPKRTTFQFLSVATFFLVPILGFGVVGLLAKSPLSQRLRLRLFQQPLGRVALLMYLFWMMLVDREVSARSKLATNPACSQLKHSLLFACCRLQARLAGPWGGCAATSFGKASGRTFRCAAVLRSWRVVPLTLALCRLRCASRRARTSTLKNCISSAYIRTGSSLSARGATLSAIEERSRRHFRMLCFVLERCVVAAASIIEYSPSH